MLKRLTDWSKIQLYKKQKNTISTLYAPLSLLKHEIWAIKNDDPPEFMPIFYMAKFDKISGAMKNN